MGYLKSIGTVIIYIGFFLTVITFLPGIPPEVEVSEYRYDIYFIYNNIITFKYIIHMHNMLCINNYDCIINF